MKAAIKRRWYVVRTNIKCEARASESLRGAGYIVYRPQMKKDVFQRRKKVMITKKLALFNRYIFVNMPAAQPDWYTLRACDGVECVLGINGTPLAVHREDVIDFMLAQRKGQFDVVAPKNMKQAAKERYPIGSRLRVRVSHPFAGFHGEVVKIKGKGVVRAMIGIFGSLTPVDLKYDDIEPVAIAKEAA